MLHSRVFSVFYVVSVLLLLPSINVFADPPALLSPPNVVMILGDDQAWNDYGFMGSQQIKTPHLDQLASESIVFNHGYVPSSLCRPSLATMMTGLYPHQHGIMSNDPPYPENVKPADRNKNAGYVADRAKMVAKFQQSPNLAGIFQANGYITMQSGKWWEGNACRCGFDSAMSHGDLLRGGRHGDEGLKIGREGLKPVVDFLDQAKKGDKPFFLWYAPMMPHQPHNPPERLLSKYKDKTDSIHVAKYWAMCEWFDETIGELLAKLDQNGQAKNTIVMYIHDNGWIQDPKSATYAPKSKQSPNEGGLRTPITFRYPGKIKPAKSEALANSIDLAPTLLQAALGEKITAKYTLPGINLLDEKQRDQREMVTGEIFLHTAVDLEKPKPNLRYRWIINRNINRNISQTSPDEKHGNNDTSIWKLIVPDDVNEKKEVVQLYDLSVDPWEENNLAESKKEKVAELQKKLNDWWKP